MRWEKNTIDELCEKVTDGSHYSPKEMTEGYPMASSKDMLENDFDYSSIKKISVVDYDKLVKGDCKPLKGDVLIIKDGNSYLKYIFTIKEEKELVVLSSIAILRPNKTLVDPLFFQHLLRAPQTKEAMGNFVSGAAIPRIVLKDFKQMSVLIPPLPTQRRIASILSAYDDLIENNLRRVKLLEEKAFLRYKEIVRSEKMEEYKIEEVCATSGGGTPSTGDLRFWDDGDVLWFSPTDLTKHNSIVLLDSEKKITELGLQKSSAKLVPPKTILMTSRASIGYFGLINKPASTNQGFINIIPFNQNHRAFLLFNLKSRKEEIIGNANGSTFLEISKSKFRQMRIRLPHNESVLLEFEKEFELVFDFIENLLKQNAKLREARDILLPRLMNGEIEA